MRVGIILEMGGSLKSLEKSGQFERFRDHYLLPYQKAFGEVVIFSYAEEREEITLLPAGVRLLACPFRLKPRLYSLLMPWIYRAEIKRCDLLRIFQMDACLPALLSKFLWKTPYVATYGYRYEKRWRIEGKFFLAFFMKSFIRLGTRWADSVLVQWGEIWDEISRMNRKVYFQPNGVDLKLFHKIDKIPHSGTNIFFVGRLVHQKNLELFIEAASLLPGISLHIVGDGPLRARHSRFAEGKLVNTVFHGNVPHQDLPQLFRKADLFAISSVVEGHVKVLSEAMACGIPCVGTDVEGIRELIQHGKTGLLCASRAEEMAAAMRRLLEDPVLAEKLGSAASQSVQEKYDLEKLVQEEIHWFRQILRQPEAEWRKFQKKPTPSFPRPLKICYVTEYFHPFSIGGGEISAFLHAKSLVQMGHRITVLTPNYGAPSQEEVEGVEIFRFSFPKKLARGEECNSLYFMNPFYWLVVAYQIIRLSHQGKFNLLHAQGTFSTLGCWIAAKWLRIPFVVTLRDYMSVCSLGAFCLQEKERPPHRCWFIQNERCMVEFQKRYSPQSRSLQKEKMFIRTFWAVIDVQLRRWAIRHADRTVVISRALGKIYQETGFNPQRMKWIPNSLPNEPTPRAVSNLLSERLSHHPTNKVVLFVGKLSLGKGVDVLFNAIPQILERLPGTSFVFAGRLTQAVKIPEAVKPHIQLLGHLPQEEIYHLYDHCDLVVIPSVWPEPSSRVALEAIVHHKPVVASRIGGIPEIVQDGVFGRLVERRNPKALAEATVEVLAGKVQYSGMTQRDAVLPEHEKSAHRLDCLYQEMILEKL